MTTITKHTHNSISNRRSTRWATVIDSDSDSDSDSDYEAKDKAKVHSLPIPSTSADEHTFADELRQFSEDALEKKAKKEEEHARIREESIGKTISFLMKQYHSQIVSGLFEAAEDGETQFRLWIYDDEDLAFYYEVEENGYIENHVNYIEPSVFSKELLNPDSKLLPFKKDGITRYAFTGLTVKHDKVYWQGEGKKILVYDFSW